MRAQVVLLQEDRVLMVRLERPGTSFWILPGGAVEDGESPEEAAVREVREETGLEVSLERLLFVEDPGVSGHVVVKSRRYTFLARVIGGTLRPQAGEVAGVAWLPLDCTEFDASTRDTVQQVRKALGAL